jgi:hypothetical protein
METKGMATAAAVFTIKDAATAQQQGKTELGIDGVEVTPGIN